MSYFGAATNHVEAFVEVLGLVVLGYSAPPDFDLAERLEQVVQTKMDLVQVQ